MEEPIKMLGNISSTMLSYDYGQNIELYFWIFFLFRILMKKESIRMPIKLINGNKRMSRLEHSYTRR